MNPTQKAIAGIAASAALMMATAGCAGKKTAPEQQPGQSAFEQQTKAFREGVSTGQEACKEQMPGEAPSVTAQLTGSKGGGCNCSCQSSKGKSKATTESSQSGSESPR